MNKYKEQIDNLSADFTSYICKELKNDDAEFRSVNYDARSELKSTYLVLTSMDLIISGVASNFGVYTLYKKLRDGDVAFYTYEMRKSSSNGQGHTYAHCKELPTKFSMLSCFKMAYQMGNFLERKNNEVKWAADKEDADMLDSFFKENKIINRSKNLNEILK